jgi:hypothetical protein
MNTSILRGVAALACTVMLLACATPSTTAPEEWDGLKKRDVKGVGLVYVRPNVQFPPYKNVMLDPVQVEFSKNWDPNSSRELARHVDAQELARIKETLAGWVRDGFSEELLKGGYAITAAPADDTIRVSAAIVNLYINALDVPTAGRSRTYTTDAGTMTLVLEVRDAPSGQLLARVVDARRASSGAGQMQWTNSVTNRAAAEKIISEWAQKFRAGLDRLKAPADGA